MTVNWEKIVGDHCGEDGKGVMLYIIHWKCIMDSVYKLKGNCIKFQSNSYQKIKRYTGI